MISLSVRLFMVVMSLSTAALFSVILVLEKMFNLFRFLVFILICYFFGETIYLLYDGMKILPILKPSSEGRYLISKD